MICNICLSFSYCRYFPVCWLSLFFIRVLRANRNFYYSTVVTFGFTSLGIQELTSIATGCQVALSFSRLYLCDSGSFRQCCGSGSAPVRIDTLIRFETWKKFCHQKVKEVGATHEDLSVITIFLNFFYSLF